MKVVLISGKSGSGKDHFASVCRGYLEAHDKKVLVTHFGDLLKYTCKEFLGWNGEKDEAGRNALQNFGTNDVRGRYPDFWAEYLARILSILDGRFDVVLVPDLRRENEISVLRDIGLDIVTVRVKRPDYENNLTLEQRNHISETALDDYKFDHVIINDNMELFHERIFDFIREVFYV